MRRCKKIKAGMNPNPCNLLQELYTIENKAYQDILGLYTRVCPLNNAITAPKAPVALPIQLPVERVQQVRIRRHRPIPTQIEPGPPETRIHSVINIGTLEVFYGNQKVELVSGEVVKQMGSFQWQNMTDGSPATFAATKNDPSGSITVRWRMPPAVNARSLDRERTVDSYGPFSWQIVITNRADCCSGRIVGCTIDLLDENGTTLATYPNMVDARTLRIGASTGFNLTYSEPFKLYA